MGSSQSARKLTVDNENAIQVSQDALDRIQAQLNSRVSIVSALHNFISMSSLRIQNSKLFARTTIPLNIPLLTINKQPYKIYRLVYLISIH